MNNATVRAPKALHDGRNSRSYAMRPTTSTAMAAPTSLAGNFYGVTPIRAGKTRVRE